MDLIRLALAEEDAETLQIHSVVTDTNLLLPKRDIPLLIAALRSPYQEWLSPETVSLDPTS